MKFFYFLLFLVLILPSSYALGIGQFTSEKEFEFYPNFEKTITMFVRPGGNPFELSVGGDLAQYATLSEPKENDGGLMTFNVHIKLPEHLENPGRNTIKIIANELPKEGQGGTISTLVTVGYNFVINVPYIGKYVLVNFNAPNVNINEAVKLNVEARNLGEEDVEKAKAVIEIFDSYNNPLKKLYTGTKPVKSRGSENFDVLFNATGYKAGNYNAVAALSWDGNQTVIESSFKIGTLNVRILNYTREAKKGEINKFNITVESGWNSRITNLFAEVKLTDNDKEITSFLTPSIVLAPWSKADLSGYLDANNLDAKEYGIEIALHYEGAAAREKGTINITEKYSLFSQANLIILLIAVIIILILVDVFVLKKKTSREKYKDSEKKLSRKK